MSELAGREEIDAIVELIGGADGPALNLARQCLSARKPFITANKAMIPHHGIDLAGQAEKTAVALKYEEAVPGGIPFIKGLRDGAAANSLRRVSGIFHCPFNFILTPLAKAGHP